MKLGDCFRGRKAARSMQGVESGFRQVTDWVTHRVESFTTSAHSWRAPGQSFLRFEDLVSSSSKRQDVTRSAPKDEISIASSLDAGRRCSISCRTAPSPRWEKNGALGRKARVLSQYGVQPDNQRYERALRTHASGQLSLRFAPVGFAPRSTRFRKVRIKVRINEPSEKLTGRKSHH